MSVVESALAESDYADCYRQFAPRGIRYAYSILRNSADSEEVVQEAFCRLLRSDRSLASLNGSFPAVLFATIRNLCIDAKRRAGRRQWLPLDSESHELTSVESDAGHAELTAAVSSALEALPSLWADALKLRMSGELNYEQIATVLQCTHAQVRTWIYRARKQIATELQAQGYLDDTHE